MLSQTRLFWGAGLERTTIVTYSSHASAPGFLVVELASRAGELYPRKT